MIYSDLFIHFLTFLPGSGQGKNMRIRADPDPKPWVKHTLFKPPKCINIYVSLCIPKKGMKREWYQRRIEQGSPLYPQEGFTKLTPALIAYTFQLQTQWTRKVVTVRRRGVAGVLLPQQGGRRRRGGKGGGKSRSRSSHQNESKPVKVSCQKGDSRYT